MINEIQPKIKFQNIVQCPFNNNIRVFQLLNHLPREHNVFVGENWLTVSEKRKRENKTKLTKNKTKNRHTSSTPPPPHIQNKHDAPDELENDPPKQSV